MSPKWPRIEKQITFRAQPQTDAAKKANSSIPNINSADKLSSEELKDRIKKMEENFSARSLLDIGIGG